MRYETETLIKIYEEHNSIIIGVDFDDTIFAFNEIEYIENRCKRVVELLLSLKMNITICLFSVADEQSLIYKTHIMELYGIKPQYINESPVKKWGECNKPYFNILLDDKAGLNEAIEILTEFKENL